MRSFGLVDNKLEEAKFFLERFEKCGWELFEASCYFNAFVSSTRSVTFAMQASLKGVEGADEWYKVWQEKLRQSRLARFFHNCRTDNQHIGTNYLVGGISGPNGPVLLLGDGSLDRQSGIPERNAFVAARTYFEIVCSIVRSAYEQFPYVIDPDRFYTLDGLKYHGLTIADVEEELGFPQGYAESLASKGFSEHDMLVGLRRHAAITNCRYILDAVNKPPDGAWR